MLTTFHSCPQVIVLNTGPEAPQLDSIETTDHEATISYFPPSGSEISYYIGRFCSLNILKDVVILVITFSIKFCSRYISELVILEIFKVLILQWAKLLLNWRGFVLTNIRTFQSTTQRVMKNTRTFSKRKHPWFDFEVLIRAPRFTSKSNRFFAAFTPFGLSTRRSPRLEHVSFFFQIIVVSYHIFDLYIKLAYGQVVYNN